jgi:hypothetical protein
MKSIEIGDMQAQAAELSKLVELSPLQVHDV